MRDFAELHVEEWGKRQGALAGIALLFAAALAGLGAFSSDEFEPFSRVGYWTIIFVAQYALAAVTMPLLRLWPAFPHLPVWQRVALGTIITSFPMFFVTAGASMTVGTWQPVPGEVVELIVSIWVIGGAYLFLWDKVSSRPLVSDRTATAPPRPNGAKEPQETLLLETALVDSLLLSRLPPELGHDVICLGNEDHYVRVYTAVGNALILMRFTDALGSVAAVAGERVHRSWWVSKDAVARFERFGRTARLELRNGLQVPVSQPYLAQAKSLWGAAAGNVAA